VKRKGAGQVAPPHFRPIGGADDGKPKVDLLDGALAADVEHAKQPGTTATIDRDEMVLFTCGAVEGWADRAVLS